MFWRRWWQGRRVGFVVGGDRPVEVPRSEKQRRLPGPMQRQASALSVRSSEESTHHQRERKRLS